MTYLLCGDNFWESLEIWHLQKYSIAQSLVDLQSIAYELLTNSFDRQAWDLALDICLRQLPTLLEDENAQFHHSPFFTEQLTAFQVWLSYGSEKRNPPEQLPIVLQVRLYDN